MRSTLAAAYGLFSQSFVCFNKDNVTTSKYLPALVALALCMAACGSADDNRPADWAYIAPAIIIPNCATSSCHSEAAAASGLDMSTPGKAYKSLTGLKTQESVCGTDDNGKYTCTLNDFKRPLITPGNPDESRVVNMMRARGAQRMPPDRPMAEADIALVEKWIALGAKNTGSSQ